MSQPASLRLPLVATLLALAGIAGAAAHDFAILPETSRPSPDKDFALSMLVTEVFPGEVVPWRTGRITEFAIVDARGRRDIEAPALDGDPPRALLRLRNPGTAIVALATDPSYITLEAPVFTSYLEEEGHDAILAARQSAAKGAAPGRERYTRYVKTIVNAGGPSASVALSRVGLAIEIVPEKDLSGLRPGASLPVRVFFKGAPYAHGTLCASAAAAPVAAHDAGAAPGRGKGPYAWCGKLDGAARATVPLPHAGWQMLRTAKMVELRDDPKADWQSYWASLTFEVASAEEAQ